MPLEFPYQLTIFLDTPPEIGEPVYDGENGWYAQVALKRRFKLTNGDETTLQKDLADYFAHVHPFTFTTKGVIKPERMPVQVVELQPNDTLMNLHTDLIAFLGEKIESRYPERDGENYYPHVTAEYNGQPVIDAEKYTNRTFSVTSVWLLKDISDENSIAYATFPLDAA